MNTKAFFVLFFLTYFVSTSASPYYKNYEKKARLCGEKLGKALSIICDGNYNSPAIKKSNIQAFDDFLANEYEDDNENGFLDLELSYPFLSEDNPRNFVPLKPRRGIVEECCHNPCSRTHLLTYCAA
ncbi:unnamed protein product [Brassicogethes aeneus]|uniref:Insulin-like domain-containing protein n=1 Tax=Brassicogethes aeneus TaxID=1431903 RepID=A0A9P0BD71_BRAAE|nr:unnamed protein product [Brassicogethes aeneus]